MTDRIEQTAGVIGDVSGLTPEECDEIARALDRVGLLAPDMRVEWAARNANGGGAICRTRDEADTALAHMTRDAHRPRFDEPPAPDIAGIYHRRVTEWEKAHHEVDTCEQVTIPAEQLREEWGKQRLDHKGRTRTLPVLTEHDARRTDWDEVTVHRRVTEWEEA